jgi:hypothetical protein
MRDKIYTSLSVAAAFSFTLFLFGPLKLYYTNVSEFKTSFFQQSPFFLAACGLSMLLVMLVFSISRGALYQKVVSLTLSVSFLLWVQGNILVWRYHLLDGREIDWNAKTVYGFIDATVWILVIATVFFLSSYLIRISRQGALALILIQLISTSFLIPNGLGKTKVNTPVADEQAIFGFSTKQNVIVFILDSIQGDYFQEIIDEDPAYRNIFEGFTYYRNATTGYPFTHAVPALILTGRYYDNSLPWDDFAKKVYSADSLPKILKGAGFQVDLLKNEDLVLFYADPTIASHLISTSQLIKEEYLHSERVAMESGMLFDITLFRYLPNTMKKIVYNNQKWLFSGFLYEKLVRSRPENRYMDAWRYRYDIDFVNKMARVAQANTDRPVFKYIHLWIAHPPARVNENLEYEDLKQDREGYKKQVKGALKLADRFLDTLKKIGIYDKTMVFVLSDHGYGKKIEMKGFGQEERSNSSVSPLAEIKGSAYPLVLVKPFGEAVGFEVSDAPVSLADVARTILSEVKLEGNIPGTSIFAIKETEERERRFFYHENARVNTRTGFYLPPLEEYSVSGPVWLDTSWRATDRVFTHEGIKHSR